MHADVLLPILVFAALQQPPGVDSGLVRPGDVRLWVTAVVATGAAAAYDEKFARWTRQPGVQGDSARHDIVKAATWVNEMPLTAAAVLTYGAGKLAGSHTVADVGLHLTASLLATEVVAEVIRVGAGRLRPRASPDDAFRFEPGAGLTKFENRAFPSLHASVAFATAASLVEEVRHRRPGAVKVAAPLLYSAAMIPGLTRLYLDQHWASDVVAGTFLGWYLGSRVTRYAHGRRTWMDRVLLGATLGPVPGSGLVLHWTW